VYPHRTRVLVVAESETLRTALPEVLAEQASVEVIGGVAPALLTADLLEAAHADVVALATGEGERTSPETLVAIRRSRTRSSILLFHAPAQLDKHLPDVAKRLVAKLDDLAGWSHATGDAGAQSVVRGAPSQPEAGVVVIGASAGGPKALMQVVADLPADLPLPLLIVQHMPAMFIKILADRLSAVGRFPVTEAANGERIGPGRGWVAPGNHHLVVRRVNGAFLLGMDGGPPENSCRPAADVLFRSAAEAYGAQVLAVVLSGMGRDGVKGCEAIRAGGGRVLVQDEATSVIWGMPGAVFRAGLADAVLPVHRLGEEIARRAAIGRLVREETASPEEACRA
jgi:two-component system chemotaxis response regulator CheB